MRPTSFDTEHENIDASLDNVEAERQTLKAKRLAYLRQLYLGFELENMTFDEFLSENGYEP